MHHHKALAQPTTRAGLAHLSVSHVLFILFYLINFPKKKPIFGFPPFWRKKTIFAWKSERVVFERKVVKRVFCFLCANNNHLWNNMLFSNFFFYGICLIISINNVHYLIIRFLKPILLIIIFYIVEKVKFISIINF